MLLDQGVCLTDDGLKTTTHDSGNQSFDASSEKGFFFFCKDGMGSLLEIVIR